LEEALQQVGHWASPQMRFVFSSRFLHFLVTAAGHPVSMGDVWEAECGDWLAHCCLRVAGLWPGLLRPMLRLGRCCRLADRKLATEVQARCVSKPVCDQAKALAMQIGDGPYSVVANDFGDNQSFSVGWYTDMKSPKLLDAKVAQFPRGTRFLMVDSGLRSATETALEKQVREIFEKDGMTLEMQATCLGS
jgi:hypothetical protein